MTLTGVAALTCAASALYLFLQSRPPAIDSALERNADPAGTKIAG